MQFLLKGYGNAERMLEQTGDGTPEIKALRSWCTLSEAMTVHGGEINELEDQWSDTQFLAPTLPETRGGAPLWVVRSVVLSKRWRPSCCS